MLRCRRRDNAKYEKYMISSLCCYGNTNVIKLAYLVSLFSVQKMCDVA